MLYSIIFPEPFTFFHCYHVTCDHYCDYYVMLMLLFICLAYVSLHALFVFDITFFPFRLISLHKIGLYISLHHNCSTDIQNRVVVFYKD